MASVISRKSERLKKQRRIRNSIIGTGERPRLCVFRSSRHIYAQVIDDAKGQTIVAASTYEKEVKGQPKFESKVAAAEFVGKLVAERALDKGVKKIVFDRNGFLYHGRIKAVSEGARKAGLEF
ncbi:MAG: 50S ribosomal protein L18 [Desulfobacteraceae bacterium]|nr:MAG: 50S ribosomal protein L18 [Desulfobacteraceae bacterium]